MYEPQLARFKSLDPLPPDGEPVLLGKIPDGLRTSAPRASTLYGYAYNNPVNNTDPSGATVVFGSAEEAQKFAAALKKAGAKDIKIEKDVVEGKEWFHVFACLSDLDAVFKYVDSDKEFSKVFGKDRFIDRGSKTKSAAERRRAFLIALLLNPARFALDVKGDDSPSGFAHSPQFLKMIGDQVKKCNAKVILKVDQGGEGRANDDRVNVNVCGIASMETVKGKRIPRLVPKTEEKQRSPFPDSSADEAYVISVNVSQDVYNSIALDSARILKVGGKIIFEGPEPEPGDVFDLIDVALKYLTDRGYQITVKPEHNVEDPHYPTIPMYRITVTIDKKP